MNKYSLLIARDSLAGVLQKTTLKPQKVDQAFVLHHFSDGQNSLFIYDNTKNKPFKAIFTGDVLPKYLSIFVSGASASNTSFFMVNDTTQIGSDEVGFGDFFGPLVVVSAYIDPPLKVKISSFQIMDSKKITNDLILSMGAELIKLVPHIKNIVHNPKYNELLTQGYNMNQLKAILHHNVLTKLAKKQNHDGNLYLDQFVNQNTFDRYIQALPKANLVLVPKGEDHCFAIALASVIARYYFLVEIQKINTKYGMSIPLGAGSKVDEFAKLFLAKHGKNAINEITKHNFRNFKDLSEAF